MPHPIITFRSTATEEIINYIDGLLLCGNDPAEWPLVEALITLNIPILATGNGLHALNIVMGGKPPIKNLHLSETHDDSPFHRIFISPGSQLAKILGSGGFVRVNSTHSFSLKEAQKSKELSVCAYGLTDGVLEGVEQCREKNIVGVQFNPERRSDLPPHFERLFQWLIKVSSDSKNEENNLRNLS